MISKDSFHCAPAVQLARCDLPLASLVRAVVDSPVRSAQSIAKNVAVYVNVPFINLINVCAVGNVYVIL